MGVYMKDEATDWGWGIVISASRRKMVPDEPNDEETADDMQWVVDVFLPTEIGSLEKQRPVPPTGTKAEGHVLPMALSLVQRISKIRSNMPEGDPKSEDIRKTLLKTLMTIKGHKRFKAGIPELDPVGEMNIKSDELTVALAEVAELDQKISESSLKGNAKLNAYVNAFERKIKLQSKVQDLEKQVSASQFMVMACELTSADEVLLTEIVFQNVF